MNASLQEWSALDKTLRATPHWYTEPRATWPAHVDIGTLPDAVYAEWLSEMDRRRENMRDQHN